MSGLDFRVVPIAFTQGQDTRTHPKLVLPGKWQQLTNCALSQDNTPRRRDGSVQLASAAVGNGLATHRNELLLVSSQVASTYSPNLGAFSSIPGEVGFVSVDRVPIYRATSMQDSPDCATSGSFTAYAWREVSQFGAVIGTRYSMFDESTGAMVIGNAELRTDASAFCPRVVWSGGAFFFFYISTSHLFCRVLVPGGGSLGAEVSLVTGAALGDLNFDACAFGSAGSSSVMVTYAWSDGTTSVRSIRVGRAGTVPSILAGPTNIVAQATVPTANIIGLCCASFDSTLTGNAGAFVLHTAGVSGVVINSAWAVSTAVALLDAFVAVGGGGGSHITAVSTNFGGPSCLQVFSDQQGGVYNTAAMTPIRTGAWSSTLGVAQAANTLTSSASFSAAGGTARGPQGPWICGKAFAGPSTTFTGGVPVVFLPVCVMENTSLAAAAPNNNTQCTFFLLDCTTGIFVTGVNKGAVAAKALCGAYGVPAINNNAPAVSTPCGTPAVGSGFMTLVNERSSLVISNGLNVSPTGLTRLTLTPNTTLPPSRVEFGPLTFFAGGQLTAYDGNAIVEHGFALFPEGVAGAISAGAGMTDGVHQIVAVYEWFDAQGERHQSGPSLPVSVTANSGAGNNQATIRVPTLLLTQKSNINIVLYMTEAAGTIFKRLTLRVGHPVANDTTVAFVTVIVTESDASIDGNEALSTQPDQADTPLPNDAPPPCKMVAVSQKRLWLLDADNPFGYRFSQALLNGVGLQFSGLFGDTTLGGVVPTNSGGTVAIAQLDERTIILCAQKLYSIYGGFPDASGNNNTFSDPQEIPSPVGCSDAASVLMMPHGLMFKSALGWYLLGRDMSVQYIGEGVSIYDSYAVVSATLMGDRQECRFEVQSGGPDGVILVYSYLEGQWSVFTRGSNASHPLVARDAVWYPELGKYVWLAPSTGVVIQNGLFADSPGTYDDFVGTASVSPVQLTAMTAWLRPAALNGFQRVRRLYLSGTSADPSTINTLLVIAVDFDDIPSQAAPGSYAVATALHSTANGIIDVRHKLERQKCKSVRFTFFEVPQLTGQLPMLGFQTMAMEIGFRRGVNKLPSGQTI